MIDFSIYHSPCPFELELQPFWFLHHSPCPINLLFLILVLATALTVCSWGGSFFGLVKELYPEQPAGGPKPPLGLVKELNP